MDSRRLVVVRHAKSAWPEGEPDAQRPLNPRGRRDAPAVGRWIRERVGRLDAVLCSPATRARQTWGLVAPELDDPPAPVLDDRVYAASVETLLAVVRDVIASAHRSGFRRILVVNGHGGNQPVAGLAGDMMVELPDLSIKFHNWWSAPKTWAHVQAIDASGSHANWMENFPWTRLADVALPGPKPACDLQLIKASSPEIVRDILGDGSYGGDYQKPDEVMLELWRVGVAETRELLEGPWPSRS